MIVCAGTREGNIVWCTTDRARVEFGPLFISRIESFGHDVRADARFLLFAKDGDMMDAMLLELGEEKSDIQMRTR